MNLEAYIRVQEGMPFWGSLPEHFCILCYFCIYLTIFMLSLALVSLMNLFGVQTFGLFIYSTTKRLIR